MKALVDTLFDKVVSNIVRLLCASLLIIILMQIFSRIFMPRAFAWTEELSRIVFIWFCMLAATLTLKLNLHIGIDFLYLKAKAGQRRIFDIAIYGLITVFGLLLIVYGTRLVILVGDEATSILRWPSGVYYACVPLSGFLYTIFSVSRVAEIVSAKERNS